MTKTSYVDYYESPIGYLEITGTDEYLTSIIFCDEKPAVTPESPPLLQECKKQLDEYFRGARKVFALPYALNGTSFRNQVWSSLVNIPFGEIASYKDVAANVGNQKAVRAVGGANGKNILAIVVPCHRVNASNGSLTGYNGGVWRKEWLLKHEQLMLRLEKETDEI